MEHKVVKANETTEQVAQNDRKEAAERVENDLKHEANSMILEEGNTKIIIGQKEFYVLELSKLSKELKEDINDILLWAKFINMERVV